MIGSDKNNSNSIMRIVGIIGIIDYKIELNLIQ